MPYTTAHFGQGTGPIVYDDLGCLGSEADLYDCPHGYIGHHNCEHSEDAGVTCSKSNLSFSLIDSKVMSWN